MLDLVILRMNKLTKKRILNRLTNVKMPRCESCLASKATVKPFGKASRASSPLELIHSDICWTHDCESTSWGFLFSHFIDDYSRYGYVYLLSHRYKALDLFEHFVSKVETQLEWTVRLFELIVVMNTSHKCLKFFLRKSVCEDNLCFLALHNKMV